MSKLPVKKYHGTFLSSQTALDYNIECAKAGQKPAHKTRELIEAWVSSRTSPKKGKTKCRSGAIRS